MVIGRNGYVVGVGDDEGFGYAVVVTPRVSKPHDYANHMFMRL
jgi:hypothetical protein